MKWSLRTCSLAVVAGIVAATAGLWADDDVNEPIAGRATTAPAEVAGPQTQGVPDALGTMGEKAPAGSRIGVVSLSNGIKIEGRVWTTLETPLRVWLEDLKNYRDIDLSLIKRVDVNVLKEGLEDDWRWLKEGSDQKIYSGKKYPNVELAYKFTLVNDQVIEGTVVAPIYTYDGNKRRMLALYKKYHGKLDEDMKDVVYIRSIQLQPGAETAAKNEKLSRKLPSIY